MSSRSDMKEQQDDFKWFGEGFEGFPRRLPEDCVEYTIFIIDTELRDYEVRQTLRDVQASANVLTKKLLKDFIWQRENFKLDLTHENGLSFLQGRTVYGDSVEDEWLIVYLLRELSKQHAGVWIRVVDTDGQFLLIEAANHLPRWLNPEVADFRVWICNGKLLIIPLEKPMAESAGKKLPVVATTLREAQRFIESDSNHLLHMIPVEKEAFYRLERYPGQIKDSIHNTLVTIPRRLAYVLHEDETYVSPVVEAFYLRDPIALRPLQATSTTDLYFPPEDLVTISVKFNKVGYAQLKSQQFEVPKFWQKILKGSSDEKARIKAETGMKITCGFEMLMSDPQNKDKRQVREIALLLEDINTGEELLPSDDSLSEWRQTNDDERWLDVNFEDFENELSGQKFRSTSGTRNDFGDKAAQNNLRRMVAKFEDLLQDDKAGPDGVEDLSDSDNGDTSDDTASQQGNMDTHDKDIHFDEGDFAAMMKQMMGMSPPKSQRTSNEVIQSHDARLNSTSDSDSEEGELRNEIHAIEQELRNAGALRLDSRFQSEASALQPESTCKGSKAHGSLAAPRTSSGENNGDLDIDMNLAENLLASFKCQDGKAGPGGSLVGLMGMRMPRDEDEESDILQRA